LHPKVQLAIVVYNLKCSRAAAEIFMWKLKCVVQGSEKNLFPEIEAYHSCRFIWGCWWGCSFSTDKGKTTVFC